MSLNSSSTFTQIQAQYMDNLPPFTSAAQAASFIAACTALMLKMPEQSGAPEAQIRFRIDLIYKERELAKQWLEANGGAGTAGGSTASGVTGPSRVTRLDFRNGRG